MKKAENLSTRHHHIRVLGGLPMLIIGIVIVAVLAVAIVFISNQDGGWQGVCGCNCAACRHRCEQASDPDHTENKS